MQWWRRINYRTPTKSHHRILYEYFNKILQKFNFSEVNFSESIRFQTGKYWNYRNKERIRGYGISIEIYKDSLEVNATPPQCTEENLQCLFEDILKDKNIENEYLNEKIRNKISKSISYSLSIKTGQKLNPKEMEILITELMKCEIPSISPNGLITFFNITTSEIQKKFNKW